MHDAVMVESIAVRRSVGRSDRVRDRLQGRQTQTDCLGLMAIKFMGSDSSILLLVLPPIPTECSRE